MLLTLTYILWGSNGNELGVAAAGTVLLFLVLLVLIVGVAGCAGGRSDEE
ncbi:hypothetical protein SALBM217S_01409 [Streptomyces griseoloalbus]